jgi:plasmid stabilization system protein ParE
VKPAFFTPAAEADVEEGFEWYEAQRPGLGQAFRRALDVAVAHIEEHPDACAVIHRYTRRVLLPKFPYGLYYRVLEHSIVVVACMHGKRHPRTWRSR